MSKEEDNNNLSDNIDEDDDDADDNSISDLSDTYDEKDDKKKEVKEIEDDEDYIDNPNSDVSDFEDEDEDEDQEEDNIGEEKHDISNYNNLEINKHDNKLNIIEDIMMEKYSNEYKKNYITESHPECLSKNYDEIYNLVNIIKNENNIIIDEFHKTLPILTKYEKTKILGIRVKQLNNNSKPYIDVDENILDNFIIADMELKQKKLPFIIQRPIQNRCEYWHIRDLEIL
jgi:DNA-directed RNA polymerase subunit K/omega